MDFLSLRSRCQFHLWNDDFVLELYEFACLRVFFRLWLEKRPVTSPSPATQDRSCIWAPRYWHIPGKSLFSLCRVFQCSAVTVGVTLMMLYYPLPLQSAHIMTLRTWREVRLLMCWPRTRGPACIRGDKAESQNVLWGPDVCCFSHLSWSSDSTVWWSWSVFLRLCLWPGRSTRGQLKLCLVGVTRGSVTTLLEATRSEIADEGSSAWKCLVSVVAVGTEAEIALNHNTTPCWRVSHTSGVCEKSTTSSAFTHEISCRVFGVFLVVKLLELLKETTRIMTGFHVTGLFGEAAKRKGVVADKVGEEKYDLWIECSFSSVSNLHFLGADGGDDFPVCRLCLKEMSRTRQDPSDGATLPRKNKQNQLWQCETLSTTSRKKDESLTRRCK